jgi:glycosyltransferase involved in cell wall biosynthesis
MSHGRKPLRIALLSYRGNPHSGGQGVYVHYLSEALADLGHMVEVFAGQPYPELAASVRLTSLPSLDLYRPDDPFRRPRLNEFREAVDALEYGLMCTAAFPEPLTFSLRASRALRARRAEFDIVHDNQCLGYGLLRFPLPTIATVHHPCSIDRDVAIAHAAGARRKLALRRWYSFTRMQGRVARRLPRIISVSGAARADVIEAFGVAPERVSVVGNGVDSELFRPLVGVRRRPGRIIATASADVPLKGLVFLVEAVAKLRTERRCDLVVVGKAAANGAVRGAIDRYGVGDSVRFETGIDRLRLVELYAEAEVAVVPSLYEGFSLPALEAMSCRLPVVATRAGALPEVVGRDGGAALLVPPGDAGALAAAMGRLLDDSSLRERMGAAGRRRILDHYTWEVSARATVDNYREVLERC